MLSPKLLVFFLPFLLSSVNGYSHPISHNAMHSVDTAVARAGQGTKVMSGAGNDTTDTVPPPWAAPDAAVAFPDATGPPQPSAFLNLRQYFAYFVIQRFKATITCDPFNVTQTWVGYRPCTYIGFYCEAPPDSPTTPTIASIDFNGFRLCAPTLVGFLDQLPDLALFHANSNNFSGPIPNVTSLRYLYELDFSNNNHSGPYPVTLLPLSNLAYLDIRFNNFAGILPPAAFLLGQLEAFFLNNNFFNGGLPVNFGSLPAQYLSLANNQFSGIIPSSIANDSGTLEELLLLNNKISGCLPYEIGLLRGLEVFDAGTNLLTGPIPLSFGCLDNVEQLNLAENQLYGKVPDLLCGLATTGSLTNLSLSNNYFTSIGGSCWSLVKSGVLDIRRNCIAGFPKQRPKAECVSFFLKPKFCPLVPYVPCGPPGWPPAVPYPPKKVGTITKALPKSNGN